MTMNLVAQVAIAAAEAEHHGNVALETLIYGLIAAGVFAALAMVTLSHRNVANRHSAKADAWAARHGQDAGHGH